MAVAASASAEHEILQQADFSGGWNCRDAPSELAPNESPDCENMTCDERGGAVKRLGLSTLSDALAGVAKNLFFWKTESLLIFQIGASVYKGSSFASVTLIHTFTSADRAAFCDFLSRLVFVHPLDGVYTYTTAAGVIQHTGGANNMEFVRGDAINVWQNTVLVGGDPRTGRAATLWRSAFGDPLTWDVSATGTWADIRDVDDGKITALGAQGGQDAIGKPGLIVCKDDSAYRVNDPDTLAYTTLHAKAGAAGALAIADLHGRTCMVNRHGIWSTDGISAPELVSGKIEPLFRSAQLDFTQMYKAAAGTKDDRVVFSLPRFVNGVTPTSNSVTLEYHPLDGWIVPHNFGCTAYAANASKALYGMSPTETKAFEVFKTGADGGAAITARFQTKWFDPAGGIKCRGRRLLVSHRGAFSLYVKRDYSLGQGDLRAIAAGQTSFTWNSWTWNDGSLWGPSAYEIYTPVHSLGVARAFSFVFQQSGTSSATGAKLLADGAAPEIGAFAVYGFAFDHIPLGLA